MNVGSLNVYNTGIIAERTSDVPGAVASNVLLNVHKSRAKAPVARISAYTECIH